MGQKVHPVGIRLGVIKNHNSVWYADKNVYSEYLKDDLEVRAYLREKLYEMVMAGGSLESPVVTNTRHLEALEKAAGSLRDVLKGMDEGITSDFIAMDMHQLGLSGAERDPLAALIMCGPFKVDHSFINGVKVIADGRFTAFDVDGALAEHRDTMKRLHDA